MKRSPSRLVLAALLLWLGAVSPAIAQAPSPETGTTSQPQGYACLAGAGVAVVLVALAGPSEVAHVMGGAPFFWSPSSLAVVWTALTAGTVTLACSMAATMAPAAQDAWDAWHAGPSIQETSP